MNMGTLTGAPKLHATELVRRTEGKRRGSYGGAVGYLRGDGAMDNCIVIRSAYVQDGTAVVQAGAGVVKDSVPQAEADETVHKAYAVPMPSPLHTEPSWRYSDELAAYCPAR